MDSFPGLTKKETKDLRFSIKRITGVDPPLSPFETMQYIEKMINEGLKPQEICDLLDIDKSNLNNYYTRIKALIPEVQQLVMWGMSNDAGLGYSSVWHYSRLGEEGQRKIYKKHMQHILIRDEVKNIAQLLERGFGTIDECFEEIIQRRSEEYYVDLVVGGITDPIIQEKLASLKDLKRSKIINKAVEELFPEEKDSITARLTPESFFLTVDNNPSVLKMIKKKGFEDKLTGLISQHV